MQNKPNYKKAKMNVSAVKTKYYENIHFRGCAQNKPNQTQIFRVDHINLNGLDNRRRNLRLCTFAQNCRNRRPIRRSNKWSRYKGVSWDKANNRYQAHVRQNGKLIRIGRFKSEIPTAKAVSIIGLAH